MIIYLDLDGDPKEIARALRRELGPDLCRRVGLALAQERVVMIDMILPPEVDPRLVRSHRPGRG
jgi:hypothetical protein